MLPMNDHSLKTSPPAAHTKNGSTAWRSRFGRGAQRTGSDAVDPTDAIALASLDPRARAGEDSTHAIGQANGDPEHEGTLYSNAFGTHTEAKAVSPLASGPPQAADSDRERSVYPIEVQKEFILSRE